MLGRKSRIRSALSRIAMVVIVVIIVVIIAAAGLVATTTHASTTTTITSLGSTSTSTPSISTTSLQSVTSSQATSSSSSSSPSSLTIDDVEFPFDGLQVSDELGSWPLWYYGSVYQTLVCENLSAEFNQGVYQYVPVLASNWTVSSNGLTYTFNLRQNVTFSNGDPFNAYQVWADMYGYYYTSDNSSATWFVSYPVFNMSSVDFGNQSIALLTQSGLINPSQQALNLMENSSWPIYVTSPSQIVFQVEYPNDYVLSVLSTGAPVDIIYDAQWVFQHGGYGTPTAANTYEATNPTPGTGPYTVTGMSMGSFMSFAQNPSYWGKSLTAAQIAANPVLDPGHYKNIYMYYKPDEDSRYIDLSSGTAQIVNVGTTTLSLVQSNSKYGVYLAPPWSAIESVIFLNTHKYPTNITAVRQAIVHVINYSQVIQQSFLGYANETVAPEYPSQSQYYDLGDLTPYQYNLTTAQNDLSGLNTSSFPTLTIDIPTACLACEDAAEIIQTGLSSVNIASQVLVSTEAQFDGQYSSYTGNLANAQTLPSITIDLSPGLAPYADTPVDAWAMTANNESYYGNYAIYANPTVQACVNDLFYTPNSTSTVPLCTQAQQQVYNDAPMVTFVNRLFDFTSTMAWNKQDVSSFYMDPAWGGQILTPVLNTVVPATS